MRARKPPSPWRLLAWFSLGLSSLAVPRTVLAQSQGRAPRVGVGPFVGERGAITRAMVQSVFTEHTGEIELLPATEVMAAANREGVATTADESTARSLGTALRLDQVVVGDIERRGRVFRLRIRVLRGRDGSSAGSASWEFDRLEEIEALRSEIWSQLSTSFRADRVDRSTSNDPPREGTRIDDPPAAPPQESPRETDRSEPNEPPPPTAPGAAAVPGLGWLHLAAMGGVAGRSWRIPLLGERTARGYQNTLFGELGVWAAVLFARLNHGHFGIGIEAGARFPVGLSSQGRDMNGMTIALSTSAFEVMAGPVLMVRPAGGGMLRLGVGLAVHQFDLDTSRLTPEQRLAPVSYLGLRVAGEGLLPFYARPDLEFGALLGGELRVAGVNGEMREAFGQNPETTLGLGVLFGLAARLDRAAPGLGLRATAEWMRYRTTFAGPGRIGTGADSVDDYTRYLFAISYSLGAERSRRESSAASSEPAPGNEPAANEAPPPSTRSEGDPFGR